MFTADIVIEFANGAFGGKQINAHSMEQVMDDAAYFVRQKVLEGRNYLDIHDDDRYTVVKHSVKGFENA